MGTAYSIDSLAAAIAREENVNPAYNNPGAIMSNGSLAQYASPEEGQSALTNLLNRAVSGQSQYYSPSMTLEQFEQTYTGGDTNAGNNVASILGVPSTTPISSFGGTANPSSSSSPSGATTPSNTGSSSDYITNLGKNFIIPGLGGFPSLVDVVLILVGILLLGGAVFGFRNATNTVITTARRGAELAAS